MLALLRTLKFILTHPLNRRHRYAALARMFKWQLGSRLVWGAVAIPFVENTVLLTKPGMAGATGNIYCGLHEFEDMSLVIHALRPGDWFVDIGANIGSYTVLAAGVSGASVLSIEPIPSTFGHLSDNVRINRLESLVQLKNIGLGSCPGTLRFSASFDTINHVLPEGAQDGTQGISVPVETLDQALPGLNPCLIKIDVEGFETEVIKGASATLAHPGLLAVLMELNGSGARYGYDETRLHEAMLSLGFTPCRYDPFGRTITPLDGSQDTRDNILYVRALEELRKRVASAPRRTINGVAL